MTDKFSAVVVTKEADWAEMRALGEAAGWFPGVGRTLSNDGGTTLTHRGAHANASPQLKAILEGVVQIEIPGYTQKQIKAILGTMTTSFHPPGGMTGRPHFDDVLKANGMVRWIDPSAPKI